MVWHLVRHGETEWNRSRRIQGQADVALNQSGRDQVARLGERLSAAEFSAIYASELSRTMESARLIRGTRDLAIEPVAELREFSYGEWEGLTFEEAEGRDPEGFAERLAGRNVDSAAPGGENMLQLIDRVRRFHDRALSEHGPGDHVMVVAHSGSLLALLNCLLNSRLSTSGASGSTWPASRSSAPIPGLACWNCGTTLAISALRLRGYE